MKTRNIIIYYTVLIAILATIAFQYQPAEEVKFEPEIKFEPELPTSGDLYEAIAWVESKGNPSATGDNGEVGLYQITPIVILDVNRIIGYNKYKNSDRLNKEKSREICEIYLDYYCRNESFENKARCWNGGPNWKNKKVTEKYWWKIKERLQNHEKAMQGMQED